MSTNFEKRQSERRKSETKLKITEEEAISQLDLHPSAVRFTDIFKDPYRVFKDQRLEKPIELKLCKCIKCPLTQKPCVLVEKVLSVRQDIDQKSILDSFESITSIINKFSQVHRVSCLVRK